MRYHLTPIRMAIIKKRKLIISVGEDVEKLELLWWECKMVHCCGNAVWQFLKKLKMELLYELAIPLLGVYPNTRT